MIKKTSVKIFLFLTVLSILLAACASATAPTVAPPGIATQQVVAGMPVTEILPDPGALNWQNVTGTKNNGALTLGSASVYLDGTSLHVSETDRVFALWNDGTLIEAEWYVGDGVNAIDTHYNTNYGNIVRLGIAGGSMVYVRRSGDVWQAALAN